MITAQRIARFHLIMTFVWMAAIIPTMLYWRESVLWVAFMSLWANVVSHAAAYSAGRAEEKVDQSTPATQSACSDEPCPP